MSLALAAGFAHAVSELQQPDVTVAAPAGSRGDEAKFRFLFDPLAAWPATLFWNYNSSGAPSQFADPSLVSGAMQQVIGTWGAVCKIQAAYAGQTGTAPEASVLDAENGPQPDQVNVLGWHATPAGIAGYTVAYPGVSGGGGLSPIIDADVVIDPSKVPAMDQLTRLLLHEFGHVLGINHSQFDAALMSGPPYSFYNTLNALTADDIRACRCLYGPPNGISTGLLCSIPPVLDFGNIAAGSSAQQTFQLTNNGNASISINDVTLSTGAYQTSGCGPGTTLPPGVNCTMNVTFSPPNAGDQGASIAIAVGEPTPYRIRLVGTASGGAASPFVATPGLVDFGNVQVTTSAATQRVKFKNDGASAVVINTMQFQGPQADEFVRSGACKPGLSVPANTSCTSDIGFSPGAAGPRNAQFVIVANDGRTTSMTVKGSGSSPVNPPQPGNVLPVIVLEYYRAVSDHYFITINPDEIAALDTGLFAGWARTGLAFKAFAISQPGFSPICRFYLPPPADSHFYSASPAECAIVQQLNPSFILESTAVMHLATPNPISGACPGTTVPIYRAWNHRPDTNHRYTTDIAVRDSMVAKGYIAEGSGPNAVTFCAPQ